VPAYSFDEHFGGVFYLFIKGMGPGLGSAGVFYEKPPLARLLALGALLSRTGREPLQSALPASEVLS
jgi:exodeoxyribonuclease V beta subunit